MKAAHYNAVENLVVFATAVLVLHAAGVSNDTTVLACQVYFWARLVHFLVYGFAVPWLRTLSFAVAWLSVVLLLLLVAKLQLLQLAPALHALLEPGLLVGKVL